MDNLREHVKCDLCDADDYDIVYEADESKILNEQELSEKYRSSGDETLIEQVVKCRKCGLTYINPRVRSNLILDGYAQGSDAVFASQTYGRQQTSKRCLKFIEKFTSKEKGTLVDIGTGDSSFPYIAKKAGWTINACELNFYLCKWAKENLGVETSQGDIFQQNYDDEQFNVVCLFDLLEHTPSPMAVLRECSRITKFNGLIVINIPNLDSWAAKILNKRWMMWLSVHLYYFDNKTIKKALEKADFEIITTKPHFQSLSLKYLVMRMEVYSKLLHELGKIFIKFTKTGNMQVRYNLGQTMILARKKV